MISKKQAQLQAEIARQRAWIAEHGSDVVGYVLRYGSKDDPDHYGSGGEVIYEADMAALQRLLERTRGGG